ncbi:MAG: TRAP transporter small permease subunit [Gammaproteobacteria bacterium]|nr:TRAP transporter small permease subunit [Gammaproteobacteria bacterium]
MQMKQLAQSITLAINAMNEWIGRAVAWLLVLMVATVAFDVAMRYLFQSGSVALQELEWHLFGVIFLGGAAYTLKHGDHVSVDVLYASRWLSDRQRLIIDIAGTVLFLLPFSALVVWSSLPFVADAWQAHEHSPDPGGLRYRWLIKAAIPAGFTLLALQGVAGLIERLGQLRAPR